MMTFITVKVLLILILTDNGILFEQASARGHAQESAGITFRLLLGTNLLPVYHHCKQHMKCETLEYQRDFYINAKNESKKSKTKNLYIRR
jgi:hypothetical protein